MVLLLHEPRNAGRLPSPRATRDAGLRGAVLCILIGQLMSLAQTNTARAGKEGGDEARTHWSFRPLRSPTPPETRDCRWVETPIDAFVLRKLEDRELKPASMASRLTLLRRLSFDLLGLPPSPAEVDRFLSDNDAAAYERLVERMLSSPQYGERWGRHWLDVVRYADTGAMRLTSYTQRPGGSAIM